MSLVVPVDESCDIVASPLALVNFDVDLPVLVMVSVNWPVDAAVIGFGWRV